MRTHRDIESAHDALERLRQGNTRFRSDESGREVGTRQARRGALVAGQAPFAIILGCSDSRVPPEIVFDQDLGHLFVIRVAGNIVAPSQLASVEFAATTLGARLVVVLGHSRCGAVRATLDALQPPVNGPSRQVDAIIDRVRPSVEPLLATEAARDPDVLMQRAVRTNIQASANQLRHGSGTLKTLIEKQGLLVVGAVYSLETGVVEFFDGATPSGAD